MANGKEIIRRDKNAQTFSLLLIFSLRFPASTSLDPRPYGPTIDDNPMIDVTRMRQE